jgi:acyl-coenzyme A synthetase/AMP-(fatty) acid ligase
MISSGIDWSARSYDELCHRFRWKIPERFNIARDVQRFVKEHLAAYEYPRIVEFVGELPRTETGKIRRSELRARERPR